MLPLTPGAKLALIGKQAKQPTVHGGGSGSVVPYYTSAPFAAIAAAVGRGGGSVTYDDGSDLARAAALAARADVALVFAASDSSEGGDRRSLTLTLTLTLILNLTLTLTLTLPLTLTLTLTRILTRR